MNTIIFNESYIDEISRHLENCKQQYELEDLPDLREKLKQRVEFFETKLDEALEFQDTVEEIENLDVPSLSVVKTITGKVIPLSNIKIIEN